MTLPLFGTLSAEPASHDIAQMTVIKGGAKAVDFHRAGGFADRLGQQVGHEPLFRAGSATSSRTRSMAAELNSGSASRYEQTRMWTDMNVGGPIISDRLFFYASYYRPQNSRDNRSNLYGELPDYKSTATRASAS